MFDFYKINSNRTCLCLFRCDSSNVFLFFFFFFNCEHPGEINIFNLLSLPQVWVGERAMITLLFVLYCHYFRFAFVWNIYIFFFSFSFFPLLHVLVIPVTSSRPSTHFNITSTWPGEEHERRNIQLTSSFYLHFTFSLFLSLLGWVCVKLLFLADAATTAFHCNQCFQVNLVKTNDESRCTD